MAQDDFARMPGHLIRRLNQRSTAIFQQRTKAASIDLTSVQYAALNALAWQPGIDQAQLAALISYDRATIGDVVKRLEQKGLIARRVSDEDRRARSLCLSEAGQETLDQARPLVEALQAEILGNLTREAQEQFIALAKKAGAASPRLRRGPAVRSRNKPARGGGRQRRSPRPGASRRWHRPSRRRPRQARRQGRRSPCRCR